MAKRYELSDEACVVVSDLFIETHGRGRPRLSARLMLDGVLWVLCSGAAWRDMPERFGPWSTVYQISFRTEPRGCLAGGVAIVFGLAKLSQMVD